MKKATFLKANKEHKCFECSSLITKGDEYSRQTRYRDPADKMYGNNGVQKTICKSCVKSHKFSFIDEKYNSPTIVKFGQYFGKEWKSLPDDDYILFLYLNNKNHQYRDEIEREFNARLNKHEFCNLQIASDVIYSSEIKMQKLTPIQAKALKYIDEHQIKELLYVKQHTEIFGITFDESNEAFVNMQRFYHQLDWTHKDAMIIQEGSYSPIFDWSLDGKTIKALCQRDILVPIKYQAGKHCRYPIVYGIKMNIFKKYLEQI